MCLLYDEYVLFLQCHKYTLIPSAHKYSEPPQFFNVQLLSIHFNIVFSLEQLFLPCKKSHFIIKKMAKSWHLKEILIVVGYGTLILQNFTNNEKFQNYQMFVL